VNGAKVKKADLYTAGNEMGVRGRENIGGGTSVWFQLATGVWPDARLEGSTTTGNNWGGRNSAIGVSSSLGDILIGIWDTPYKQNGGAGNVINSGGFGPFGVILGNGDSTGALPNAQCGGAVNNGSGAILAGTPVCVVEVTTNSTSWSKRISNSIQYWSPRMAGVQVKLATAMYNYKSPENAPLAAGQQDVGFLSGNVTYARGPLSVGLGFETHKGFQATNAANSKLDGTDTGVLIGAKWNFGPGQVGVAYETLDYDPTTTAAGAQGFKINNTSITAKWNVGPGAVWAGYTATPGGKDCVDNTNGPGNSACGDSGKANETVVGYDYVMSKRSKLFLAYAKFDNGTRTNYYYIAGPAANSTGFGGGLARGTDVTTVAVGLNHTF